MTHLYLGFLLVLSGVESLRRLGTGLGKSLLTAWKPCTTPSPLQWPWHLLFILTPIPWDRQDFPFHGCDNQESARLDNLPQDWELRTEVAIIARDTGKDVLSSCELHTSAQVFSLAILCSPCHTSLPSDFSTRHSLTEPNIASSRNWQLTETSGHYLAECHTQMQ